jgi:hypothetical protein
MATEKTDFAIPGACKRRRTTGELTDAQLWLLQTMREHQFGRIENLRVQGGQPIRDRGVRVVRAARLGGQGERASIPGDEFELKHEACDLIDELTQLGSGMVVKLEFRHGLPFLIETTAELDIESGPTESQPRGGEQ